MRTEPWASAASMHAQCAMADEPMERSVAPSVVAQTEAPANPYCAHCGDALGNGKPERAYCNGRCRAAASRLRTVIRALVDNPTTIKELPLDLANALLVGLDAIRSRLVERTARPGTSNGASR